MTWEVEYSDEFGDWWNSLSEAEQESLDASVRLLEERGPNLGFPHSSGINGSKHSHMRDGDDRWYDTHVPLADRLYDEHLEQVRKEGLADG